MARLIVVSGPSGAGKGTLIERVVPEFDEVFVSVSATTRPRRAGEREGEAYYFLSRPEFLRRVEAGDFLEWAEYGGNLYGTPREPVDAYLRVGQDVILEIELQGARQVMTRVSDAVGVFIAPPDLQALEDRLRGRNTDSEDSINRRLEHARDELDALAGDPGGQRGAAEFRYVIVNDDLEVATEELRAILQSIRENDPAR